MRARWDAARAKATRMVAQSACPQHNPCVYQSCGVAVIHADGIQPVCLPLLGAQVVGVVAVEAVRAVVVAAAVVRATRRPGHRASTPVVALTQGRE